MRETSLNCGLCIVVSMLSSLTRHAHFFVKLGVIITLSFSSFFIFKSANALEGANGAEEECPLMLQAKALDSLRSYPFLQVIEGTAQRSDHVLGKCKYIQQYIVKFLYFPASEKLNKVSPRRVLIIIPNIHLSFQNTILKIDNDLMENITFGEKNNTWRNCNFENSYNFNFNETQPYYSYFVSKNKLITINEDKNFLFKSCDDACRVWYHDELFNFFYHIPEKYICLSDKLSDFIAKTIRTNLDYEE